MRVVIQLQRKRKEFDDGRYAIYDAWIRTESTDRKGTVVGDLREAASMDWFSAEAEWLDHPVYGEQLKVSRVVGEVDASGKEPATLQEALLMYLRSGKVDNIGDVLARRLITTLGEGPAVDALDNADLATLQAVPGIGELRAASLVKAWTEDREYREALFDVVRLGLPSAVARGVLGYYGIARAYRTVESNPWVLLRAAWSQQEDEDAETPDGAAWHNQVTFELCDEVAVGLGLPWDHMGRIGITVALALREAGREGHTTMTTQSASFAAVKVLQQLGGPMPKASRNEYFDVLDRLYHEGLLGGDHGVLRHYSSPGREESVALEALYTSEYLIQKAATAPLSGAFLRCREAIHGAQQLLGFALDQYQVEACETPFQGSRLSILTGGPGTGKTTIVNTVAAAAEALSLTVTLLAPTGKAAKRLAELTGKEASTIHRFLGRMLAGAPGGGQNSLTIVDEASMLDVRLFARLLNVVTGPILLVGDVDQLPSIGPGRVLNDLIESGCVPTTRLHRIYRQGEGSGIVALAKAIREQDYAAIAAGPDVLWTHLSGNVGQTIADARQDMANDLGVDPDDIPVLCPQHKGTAGIYALNRVLRDASPRQDQYPIYDTPFWSLFLGDPVVWTKNDLTKGLVNGDQGVLYDATDDELLVEFDTGTVPISTKEAKYLRPRYAMSVHKFQGSQAPGVLFVATPEGGRALQNALVYTAITRAERRVHLLESGGSLQKCVLTKTAASRQTVLPYLLR